ncbi:MAG TPA: rhomboid family intramembrane serine protease [Gemmatimonadaceae bacterium]|jgi:membrane associated rhomboid family serine protease|nr:rhomboid family intramembrane serine protease [Gemmatimonadaceae bacterium]
MSELYETSDSPRVTRAVQWLLALNIGVYFLQLTLFGSDAIYSALALDPARFPADWWTVLSYMFVHAWLAHLAFNMFTLWMFGPRLEQEWGTRTFVWFYLCSGIGGAVAHLIFAPHTSVIGASGAISGVLVAYALNWPDEEVYLFGVIPMRSRWLVVALLAMNIIFALSPSSRIDWTAHVGGMAFGWIFLKLYSVGGINRVRGWVSAVPDESEDMPRAVPRNRSPMRDRAAGVDEVVERSNAIVLRESKPIQHVPKQESAKDYAAKVNRVLDKISQHGIESLTRDERRLLEEMSRKLRQED